MAQTLVNPSLSALSKGGRVVIIGGGPGGSACALALNHLAAQMARDIDITVVEGKQLTSERHYNQCVGVLAPPLPTLLKDRLGVDFPDHLCQRVIRGYVLHGSHEQISLEGDGGDSYALRRVQFDSYMLHAVIQKGVRVLTGRAVDLEFHTDRVVVYTDNNPIEADVVVGAFGMDEGSAALFARLTPYRPPKAISSIVTKHHAEPAVFADIGDYVHAYLPSNPGIEFGAVTPKYDHLTINIAGSDVETTLMDSFLDQTEVQRVLIEPDNATMFHPNHLQYFKGRFPCSLAQAYFGDRYVMVGDAAGLVRAFKGKGVTTAVQTGIFAAETILHHGISKQAFHQYYRTANQEIIRDLPYGQVMRFFTKVITRYGFIDSIIRAARQNPTLKSALFDAVSGHALFQDIFKRSLRPIPLWEISRAVLGNLR